MSPQVERRRYRNFRRPGGSRRADRVAAPANLLHWGVVLWTIAAIVGTAYGVGWLHNLI